MRSTARLEVPSSGEASCRRWPQVPLNEQQTRQEGGEEGGGGWEPGCSWQSCRGRRAKALVPVDQTGPRELPELPVQGWGCSVARARGAAREAQVHKYQQPQREGSHCELPHEGLWPWRRPSQALPRWGLSVRGAECMGVPSWGARAGGCWAEEVLQRVQGLWEAPGRPKRCGALCTPSLADLPFLCHQGTNVLGP